MFIVNEEEIEASGILTGSPYKPSCLAFIRQLNNINYGHNKTWRFIDQNDDGSLDEEAQGKSLFTVATKTLTF